MVLADGARAEAFEQHLEAGDLPNIAEHVVERGSYRRGTSVFTSTTGPAHLPFLTGCFPGTADVPGYRWFDRTRHRRGLWMGPWCLRSYNGPEASFADRDVSAAAPSAYEIAADPVNVFGWFTRGLPSRGNVMGRHKNWLWMWAHYAHDYHRADRWAARALAQVAGMPSELRFVAFPGIDWNSHYVDPFGPETAESFRIIDRALGAAAARLRAVGTYEETLIAIVSDHGHLPVHTHYDLPVRLERDFGLRVAYHSWPVFRRRPDAVACVSGNGMAHVYFRDRHGGWGSAPTREEIEARHPGLRERLLAEEAVDLVVTRSESGLVVESGRGRADLQETDNGVRWVPREGDPFGWEPLPERMSLRDALELTSESGHPDALVQIAQLFRSQRCGDLVVSAKPGFDLRERFERPEHLSSHGALHRDHMLVPVASSAPLSEGPLRTADVFPTVLAWLGREAPSGIDGISRLA